MRPKQNHLFWQFFNDVLANFDEQMFVLESYSSTTRWSCGVWLLLLRMILLAFVWLLLLLGSHEIFEKLFRVVPEAILHFALSQHDQA